MTTREIIALYCLQLVMLDVVSRTLNVDVGAASMMVVRIIMILL